MSLKDAEKDIDEGEYTDAIEDLEDQIDSVEHDFDEVKDEEASGDLKRKQQKAENILNDIHDQLEVLHRQIENARRNK